MRNAPGTLDVFIKHAQLHGFHDRELAVFRALHVAAHDLTAYLEEPEKTAYADPRTMRQDEENKRRALEVALIEATNMARTLFGEP
jgi:hypothetical protein